MGDERKPADVPLFGQHRGVQEIDHHEGARAIFGTACAEGMAGAHWLGVEQPDVAQMEPLRAGKPKSSTRRSSPSPAA